MLDKDTARKTIEDALGGPLRDKEFEKLVENEHVRDVQKGEPGAIDNAVAEIREGRATFGGLPFAFKKSIRRMDTQDRAQPRRRHAKGLDWHEDALSDVLAFHAGQDPDRIQNPEDRSLVRSLGVAAFRREVLRDRLLPADRVGEWIQNAARRESTERGAPRASRGKPLLLAYGLPSVSNVLHEVVVPGGALDRLRGISGRLGKFYGWQDAQATVFVLTGVTPKLDALLAEVHFSDPLSARSRIILTIDPKVTPREVADFYRTVRKAEFSRMKRLSEKHASLAAFEAPQPAERPWKERLRDWNQKCAREKRPQKWRYAERVIGRFKRDCRMAVERIVGL
jgi:hypothetical protein